MTARIQTPEPRDTLETESAALQSSPTKLPASRSAVPASRDMPGMVSSSSTASLAAQDCQMHSHSAAQRIPAGRAPEGAAPSASVWPARSAAPPSSPLRAQRPSLAHHAAPGEHCAPLTPSLSLADTHKLASLVSSTARHVQPVNGTTPGYSGTSSTVGAACRSAPAALTADNLS